MCLSSDNVSCKPLLLMISFVDMKPSWEDVVRELKKSDERKAAWSSKNRKLIDRIYN